MTITKPPLQPRRPRRKLWLVAVVVLAGLGYAATRGNSTANGDVRYETSPITQGDLNVTVAASGTLEPTNVVMVGSELSGIVARVEVDLNDRVRKGDLLAQLDPAKLNDALTKSQAALTAAQASVKQAEASLQHDHATLNRLKELDRLTNHKVPSRAEMESAVSAAAAAEAGLASARASIAQAEAQLSSDKTNLEKASIRSPIDGIVLSRSVDAGQTVAASFSAPTLFEIAEDLAKMELNVAVDEADVGQVKEGQLATFAVDAYPGRTYPAKVTRVALGSTITDNVVTYTTTLEVDNGDLSLRPGMTASAIITTETRANVLLVPAAALRFSPPLPKAEGSSGGIVSSLVPRMPRAQITPRAGVGEQPDLWILEKGVPRQIVITKGASNGSQTEVSGEALRAGLDVIIASSTAP